MTTRTVRAIRRDDGRLELLEPVELPTGAVITLTLDLPDEVADAPSPLATRKLGPMKSVPTRDDLYADRTR